MNRAALLVLVLDFLSIGALPVIFFRRDGRLSLMWWLTAVPFFACPVLLVGAWSGLLPLSQRYVSLLGPWQDVASVLMSVSSIAMIFLTLGTHRIPIALWHQTNDAPRQLVTWGAYRYVRHPFYASFLLAYAGACLLYPHPAVLALCVYSAAVLNLTAAKEERRLAASEFGDEYRAYMAKTGRFFPRWNRAP
jgi:protein-S-isoprenylcysteine O-methyltransferase Ste14